MLRCSSPRDFNTNKMITIITRGRTSHSQSSHPIKAITTILVSVTTEVEEDSGVVEVEVVTEGECPMVTAAEVEIEGVVITEVVEVAVLTHHDRITTDQMVTKVTMATTLVVDSRNVKAVWEGEAIVDLVVQGVVPHVVETGEGLGAALIPSNKLHENPCGNQLTDTKIL